jgi:hypothetical protein
MDNEQQIRELAYLIWEEEGRPEGKHLEHYFRAEQIILQRQPKVISAKPKASKPRASRRAPKNVK